MQHKHQPYFSGLTIFVSLLMTSSLASAGGSVGSITHAPFAASSVPTIGGAGLIILAMLLGVVAVRLIKNQQNSGTAWLVAATCVSALATGGSGIKLINDAYAGPPSAQMVDAAGGIISLSNIGCIVVTNKTPVAQTIVDIQTNFGFGLVPCDIGNGGINGGGNGGSYRGTCDHAPSATILGPDDFCDIEGVQFE